MFNLSCFQSYSLDTLASKADAEPLLDSLYSILSQAPEHDVSGDVAEAVGYEDMDLVMEIIQTRSALVKEVRSVIFC